MFNFEKSNPLFQDIRKKNLDNLEQHTAGQLSKDILSEVFCVYQGLFVQLNLLEAAVYAGDIEIYEFIREHTSLEPNDECLAIAAVLNHQTMLQHLLNNTSLNATYQRNKPLRLAAEYGSKEALQTLLARTETNAGDCENYALRKAVGNCHTHVVEILLENPKVNAGVLNGRCLVLAATNGDLPMVKTLVSSSEFTGAEDGYRALLLAAERENKQIATLIYNQSKASGKPFPLDSDTEVSKAVAALVEDGASKELTSDLLRINMV